MPLPQLKRLVLRLIAVEELRPPLLPRLDPDRAAKIADQIRAEFVDETGNERGFEAAGTSVEALVEAQLERIANVRKLMRDKTDRALFRRFAKLLTERSKKSLCSGCTHGDACKDDPAHDDSLLDHPGLCIGTINKCFKFICAQVAVIHEQWAFQESPAQEWPQIRFSREFVGGPAGGSPVASRYRGALSAETVFDDQPAPGQALSKVTVRFDGRHFDWNCLLAVPWVITHELVCHAFQGRVGATRMSCESDCPFFEGWMDEVAALVLDAIVVRGIVQTGKVEQPDFLIQNSSLIGKESQDFRDWRYRTHEPKRGFPEKKWDQGRNAATWAFDFLRRKIAPQHPALNYDEGLKLLVRLSVSIQRRDPDKYDAEAIALTLGSLAAFAVVRPSGSKQVEQVRSLMFSTLETRAWLAALVAAETRLQDS